MISLVPLPPEPEDDPPASPDEAAEDRGDGPGHPPAGRGVGDRHGGRSPRPAVSRGLGEPRLGPGHEVDGGEIGLPERGAPGAEPVLLEDDPPRLRMRPHGVPHLPGQLEAGPAIRHPHRVPPEQRFHDLPAALGVGEADDRIRVGDLAVIRGRSRRELRRRRVRRVRFVEMKETENAPPLNPVEPPFKRLS